MHSNLYKLLLLSVILLLFSCGDKTQETKGETVSDSRIFVSKTQFEASAMSLGRLEEKPFPLTVQTTGMIDVPPENRAVVNATMGGYIKTTPLLIGDKVRKGQALVTVENPEFISLQQEYMEVYEQLNYLKSEFERQKMMVEEKITSQKNFLQSESTYKTALAKHTGLRKQLQMLNISPTSVEAGNVRSTVTIYAPIDGSITKVNVSRGTYVSPATAILEIIDNDHIHIELSVFEKDIMKVKKGQKIEFKIPESSEETFKAEVYLVGSAIENNRTIKVHGHLEDESKVHFLTGMFVEADIVTESAFAKALPETSIVSLEGSSFVLKLMEENSEGYYFEQIPVTMGAVYEGNVAVNSFESLSDTDLLLTSGAFILIADE